MTNSPYIPEVWYQRKQLTVVHPMRAGITREGERKRKNKLRYWL